jgi:MFS superfamily sulfate permease-like transporter
VVVVVVGVLLNEAFRGWFTNFYLRAEDGHLLSVPMDGLPGFFGQLRWPEWSRLLDRDVYRIGAIVALVASIESLISLEAADKMDPARRISNPDRELLAQGAGNILAGLLGGLPVTAVIVRTSANVYAGARTRWSSLTHGVLLVACILLFPTALNRIPLASLAAILIIIGYKLTNFALYRSMWKAGLDQFLPFIITILAIVFTDLLTGVLIGIVVGAIFVIRTNHHDAFTLVHRDTMYLLRLNKDASFVNKTELKTKLASLPDGAQLIIDGSKATFIDSDVYDVLTDFTESAKHRNIRIELKNFLDKSQAYRKERVRNGVVQKIAAGQ